MTITLLLNNELGKLGVVVVELVVFDAGSDILAGVDGTFVIGFVFVVVALVEALDASTVYSKLTAVADAGKFDKSV